MFRLSAVSGKICRWLPPPRLARRVNIVTISVIFPYLTFGRVIDLDPLRIGLLFKDKIIFLLESHFLLHLGLPDLDTSLFVLIRILFINKQKKI
jgi:hypothetical protein